MRKLLAIVLLAIAGGALGQSGNFPALVGQRGTTLPTNCTIGQLFFDTDATAGGNIYGCTAANTWTQMEGGSAITGCTYAANVLTCPTITATTAFIAPANTAGTNVYKFAGWTAGISHTAGDDSMLFTGNSVISTKIGSTGISLGAARSVRWASSGDPSSGGASDLFVSRYAAKQLMISGDGTGATTNAGIVAGYCGTTGQGCIWASPVGGTLSGTNASVLMTTTTLVLNASASGSLTFGGNIVSPASSGTRYLCINTSGVVTSSASACSGT